MTFKNLNINFKHCLILIFSILFLTGCTKVQVRNKDVEVTIVRAYCEEDDDYYLIGGTIYCDDDDSYYLVVDYNGTHYTIEDEDSYNKYKSKIGEKAIGIMRYFIYDNDYTDCEIIALY